MLTPCQFPKYKGRCWPPVTVSSKNTRVDADPLLVPKMLGWVFDWSNMDFCIWLRTYCSLTSFWLNNMTPLFVILSCLVSPFFCEKCQKIAVSRVKGTKSFWTFVRALLVGLSLVFWALTASEVFWNLSLISEISDLPTFTLVCFNFCSFTCCPSSVH